MLHVYNGHKTAGIGPEIDATYEGHVQKHLREAFHGMDDLEMLEGISTQACMVRDAKHMAHWEQIVYSCPESSV